MSKINHLFKVNQLVRCEFDGELLKGTIKEVHEDYIIVDVPQISDHCYFDEDMLDMVYPEYNF